jgi:hypothetical protein
MINDYKYYVCVTQEGEMIALDNTSGGYPYVPQTLQFVSLWVSKTEAERYCSVFKKNSGALSRFDNMKVKEFTFSLKD